MDAPELSDCIALAVGALKKMMSDSNDVAFSLGGDLSVAWTSSVQMGWHDVMAAVINDMHKLSGLCNEFELVLGDVLHSNSEMDRIDYIWNFITILNNTPLASSSAFQTFSATVETTVASCDASLSGAIDEHSVSAKQLVDAYPATVTAAVASLKFFAVIWSHIKSDVAELILWASKYPLSEVHNFPPVLACFRRMGLSIYFSNAHMIDAFGNALVAAE